MTNELEPCPFCGGEVTHETSDLGGLFVCQNPKCDARFKFPGDFSRPVKHKEESERRFNTRYKRTCHGIKNESEPKEQWVRCSECNCELWWQDPTTSEHVINFCSNCGAEVVDG